MKQCSKCRRVKSASCFPYDRKLKSKRANWCKKCWCKIQAEWRANNPKAYEQDRARYLTRVAADPKGYRRKWRLAGRRWRRNNPRRLKELQRRCNYGIEPFQFKCLRRTQNNQCAICKRVFRTTPHIDHCHKSKIVRGLLCGSCNCGLGYFRESTKALRLAVQYLKKHDTNCH